MEKIKSGVDGVDELLSGGFPKGKIVMVSGSSGCGKTIFASQFLYEGLKRREPCVFITLEQPKAKLIDDLAEIGVEFAKYEKDGLLRVIGGPVGHVKYFKEKTKASILDIADEIAEVIKEIGAKRVVLDSVNLFTMLFETELEQRRAMADLVAVLGDLACTSLLTCEVKENTDNISWHGFEEFVVDGVIVLYRKPFGNKYERAISVIKMRGVNHSQRVVSLQITKQGIVAFPDREPYFEMLNGGKKGGN